MASFRSDYRPRNECPRLESHQDTPKVTGSPSYHTELANHQESKELTLTRVSSGAQIGAQFEWKHYRVIAVKAEIVAFVDLLVTLPGPDRITMLEQIPLDLRREAAVQMHYAYRVEEHSPEACGSNVFWASRGLFENFHQIVKDFASFGRWRVLY